MRYALSVTSRSSDPRTIRTRATNEPSLSVGYVKKFTKSLAAESEAQGHLISQMMELYGNIRLTKMVEQYEVGAIGTVIHMNACSAMLIDFGNDLKIVNADEAKRCTTPPQKPTDGR